MMSVKFANQVQAQQNRLISFVLSIVHVYGSWHLYQCRAKWQTATVFVMPKLCVNQTTSFFKT